MNQIDITGEKHNMWSVIECVGKNKSGGYMYRCVCDCGNERIAEGRSVRVGTSKCCGCTRGIGNQYNAKHNGKKERLYSVWSSMRSRCLNENDTNYSRYGGRGLTICDEWNDYEVFREWAINSGYDANAEYSACTIDRIDNDKGYSPDNCRWVSQKTQDNNRSSNHFITNKDGVTKTISEWSEITGIRKDTLRRRIVVYGWDIDRALNEPVHK